MPDEAAFTLRGRNPDVLSCIANLSNDEVFTPPDLANRMLDTLAEAWAESHGGRTLWEDETVILDPCTKSGVFLREITRRLTAGLARKIPDMQARVTHILTRQVFGIAITQLTALMARRSLYCSKNAQGEHSIVKSFATNSGNIWFERTAHRWQDGKCEFCGAPNSLFDRKTGVENYAYPFIHVTELSAWLKDLFGDAMRFDVIIGNPPYQMSGGAGGSSDSSIYHLFVEQAERLEPRFLCMVIPSRWMAGGRGLDEFRSRMLRGGHVRKLVDFLDSGEAFPNLQIKGGVCYFLWDAGHNGQCDVTRVAHGEEQQQRSRDIGEFDVFIRDERALTILRKVLSIKEPSLIDLVSGDTPFGLATNYSEWKAKQGQNGLPLHLISGGRRTVGFIDSNSVRKNSDLVGRWKVLAPKAYGAGEQIPHQILGQPIIAPPPSACTQSYLVIGPFASGLEARSFESYYRTRFFRFLVSLRKITQDALRSTYLWVPQQSWLENWTDEKLAHKYQLTRSDIEYIEAVIRSMPSASDEAD